MGYPGRGMNNAGSAKSARVDGVLTADDKRSIVAMLEKACPEEMALMRLEAAKLNFEYMQARTDLAMAQVQADRFERRGYKAMGEVD
jgi:hypothetical protein